MPLKSILISQRHKDRVITYIVSVMKYHGHRNLFLRLQVVYMHEIKQTKIDKGKSF